MRKGSLFLIFAALVILSMLRGGTEVDRQAFAISMGIDAGDQSALEVTLILPSAQTGGDDGSGGGTTSSRSGGYAQVSASAETYQDALMLLRTTIPREINFTQVLQIVISEELAMQEGLDKLLQEIFSTPRMNHSATPVISRGDAKEFLQAQKPTLGVRLSKKILFSLEEYMELGFIPRAQLGEVVRMMNEGSWKSAILPYAAHQSGESTAVQAGNAYDLTAGQVPTEGGDQVVYLGAAVMGNSSMAGVLTGEEMQYLSYALGEMKEIEYEYAGSYYRLQPRRGISVQVKENGGEWLLQVQGGIAASPVGTARVDREALRDAFSEDVLKVLRKLQEWNVDPVGFKGKAAAGVLTLDEWETMNWNQHYSEAALEVSAQVLVGEAY